MKIYLYFFFNRIRSNPSSIMHHLLDLYQQNLIILFSLSILFQSHWMKSERKKKSLINYRFDSFSIAEKKSFVIYRTKYIVLGCLEVFVLNVLCVCIVGCQTLLSVATQFRYHIHVTYLIKRSTLSRTRICTLCSVFQIRFERYIYYNFNFMNI